MGIPITSHGRVPNDAYSYRRDAGVPSFPDDHPIIVFDGVCALCSAWARHILRYDRAQRFKLLAAQSVLGRAIYVHYGLDPDVYETNILIENGVAFFKSEGSIRMFEGLGFPWSMARLLRIVPVSLRDRSYEWIARNRYRFFGTTDLCFKPRPEDQARFLA